MKNESKYPLKHLGELSTKEKMIYDESGETLATCKYEVDAESFVKCVNERKELIKALKDLQAMYCDVLQKYEIRADVFQDKGYILSQKMIEKAETK